MFKVIIINFVQYREEVLHSWVIACCKKKKKLTVKPPMIILLVIYGYIQWCALTIARMIVLKLPNVCRFLFL